MDADDYTDDVAARCRRNSPAEPRSVCRPDSRAYYRAIALFNTATNPAADTTSIGLPKPWADEYTNTDTKHSAGV